MLDLIARRLTSANYDVETRLLCKEWNQIHVLSLQMTGCFSHAFIYAFLLSTQWVMHVLNGHRRSFLHDDFFFPPANMYAKLVKASTMDNFTNSITTLNIISGNSIGRSCHTIRAETIKALIRIMICFRFIFHLPADTTQTASQNVHLPAESGSKERRCASSFVIAAYVCVRLIPQVSLS